MATVLVIESEAPLLRLLTWGLMEEGFKVSMTRSPAEAAGRIASMDPGAVILNSSEPAEQRRTVIAAVRAVAPSICVIELQPRNEDAPSSTGANATVAYPYTVAGIASLINDCQRGS